MAIQFESAPAPRDPRAVAILAKSIYRELVSSGYGAKDVMALAGELLGMVAAELRTSRGKDA